VPEIQGTTVKELIELLQTLPQDHIVVMSADGEGNNYSPYADYGLGRYTPETTWYGEFTSWDEDEDDEGEFLNSEPVRLPVEKQNAVVLWPVN
jgi:hypothetical protein